MQIMSTTVVVDFDGIIKMKDTCEVFSSIDIPLHQIDKIKYTSFKQNEYLTKFSLKIILLSISPCYFIFLRIQ